MSNAASRLDTIFGEAIEIADPAVRAAYLEHACGQDVVFRQRLAALVAAHFKAGQSFLASPIFAESTADFTSDRDDGAIEAGSDIGPYRLREQIGLGGMGVVYVAEQMEPVHRKVALKVIKPGMDSPQVVARFEAERQALALMDHPNIARVFDGGLTPDGRPYFVMELVKGEPLTVHCDAQNLSVRDRLGLFVQVCRAVQHAHQKGVIHRDIKPTNVLVAVHDVTPVAKVIDFGIAKSVGQELTNKTVYTAFAQMLGTPLYMSPEQAGQSSLDVDTRTDVFSLGVLLYELLTGTTPVDPAILRKAGLDEVRRVIREDEPPRPSVRLSTLQAAAQTTIADHRRADPRKLAAEVRGELDWVVMKCLEKDRERRYDSAAALAADIERYLTDEPVLACPPSVGYRLRKFARRNRAMLVTAGLVAAALVAGVGVSLWQAVEADAARKLADARYHDEQKAKSEAAAQSERASENYRRARAAVKQMLARVATDEVGAILEMKEVRRKLLEDAATFYTELLRVEPEDVEALFERGNVNAALAQPEKAIRDYEAVLALAPHRSDCAILLANKLFYDRKDYRGAIALALRAAAQSPDHVEGYYLAAYAYHHLEDKVASRAALHEYRERAPLSGVREANTAWIHLLWGETDAALPPARRAVQLDPGSWYCHFRLASCLDTVGDHDGAFAAINAAIRFNPRQNDPGHSHTFYLRGNYHLRARRYAAAVADFKTCLDMGSARPGYVYKRLSLAQFHLGEYPAALANLEAAVDQKDLSALTWIPPKQVAACPDPAFRNGVLNLISRQIDRTNGPAAALAARAQLYDALGRHSNAAEDWAAVAAGCRRERAALAGQSGPKRNEALRELADIQALLGQSLLHRRLYSEAEPVLRECLAVRETLATETWQRFNAMSMLGEALLGQKKYAEAEPMLLEGYDGIKQRQWSIAEPSQERVREAAERVALLYEATDQLQKAREWRAKEPHELAPRPRPVRE